ncbi:MAG TPA: hypothetical protein VMH39_08390 [Gemmatimonadaceae bacterium]|nr:hypothetical protein [Gemmatimonadaceae bacterium]
MSRFRADVWREQLLEVEFEVEDDSQDLKAVAIEAANGEWFEAETMSTYVEHVRIVAEVAGE